MSHTGLETLITAAFEDRANITAETQGDVRRAVDSALRLLDAGKLRVAEKIEGQEGPESWNGQSVAEKGRAAVVPLERHGGHRGRARRRDLVGQGPLEIRRLGRARAQRRRAFAPCRARSCAIRPMWRPARF